MAEQRLIDSNVDVSNYVETWTCNCSDYGVQNVMAVDDISTLPEIDPETMPIVRELREANLKAECRADALMAKILVLEEELKQVAAERDAAVE